MKKNLLIGICILVVAVGYFIYRFLLPIEVKFFQRNSVRELIQNSPYYLDHDGWEYVMQGESNGYNSISFGKTDADTSKHIIFLLDDNDEPFQIFEFKKDFLLNDKFRYFVRMNSSDTLFAYIEKSNGDKFFISGEYYYKYTFVKLDTGQLDYFILYSDSLTKIKGNNLRELPYLNERDRKRYRERFN